MRDVEVAGGRVHPTPASIPPGVGGRMQRGFQHPAMVAGSERLNRHSHALLDLDDGAAMVDHEESFRAMAVATGLPADDHEFGNVAMLTQTLRAMIEQNVGINTAVGGALAQVWLAGYFTRQEQEKLEAAERGQ